MSEYRRQIVLGSALAIIVGLGLGLGIVYLPQQQNSTASVSSGTVSNTLGGITTTITATGSPTGNSSGPISPPALLLGELSASNVSCSLASGVCTMTIVNNSNASLDLVACEITVIAGSSGRVTESVAVNGTMGGPATAGIAANSQVSATCTVQTSVLSHQASGSAAEGGFEVKLVDSYGSYPAGSDAYFGFQGTWS